MITTPASLRFNALGTEVEIFSPAAAYLGEKPRFLVADYEARFSRFLPESELQRVCEAAGVEIAVSEEMFEVLSLAAHFWRDTDGIFDPLIRPSLEAAGYDRTFRAIPRTSAEPAPPPRPERFTFGDACLNAKRRSVLLPKGASLDLGGIAKGWILDRLGAFLATYGPFLIDIGGDIVARRDGPDGGPGWLISVAHPHSPELDLCWLRLQGQAIATSTTMRRRWQRDGRWLHHIIDPRTGAPARDDVSQVTVVAPRAVEADISAKTALIMGRADGLDWLEARGLPALLVTETGPISTPRWLSLELPLNVGSMEFEGLRS
jgi:thiamine biosynthesis lipoprotein